MNRLARTRMVRKRPMLIGYIACIVTVELLMKIAQTIGWIR